MAVRKAMAAPAQFQQENFSEYHLYSLGRKTSVEDKETKQISLLQGSGVPVVKLFIVNGQNFYYHNAQNPGSPLKDDVMVYYKFKNEEKADWGFPCRRETCGFIKRIQRAECCLWEKTGSITRRKMNS